MFVNKFGSLPQNSRLITSFSADKIQKISASSVNANQSLENANTTAKNEEWKNALPFEKIPSPKKLSLLKNFLPGGKYFKKERPEMTRLMHEEFGHIMRMPGLFGKRDMILTDDPDNFQKIYRVEGVWPNRPALDTFDYYRRVKNPDAFDGVGGLMAEQDEKWAYIRSMVNPVLIQPKTVRFYIPKINKVTDEFIQRIKTVRNSETNEVHGNFEHDLNCWSLESVCVIAMDTELGLINNIDKNPDAKLLIETVSSFFKLVTALDLFPSLWKIVGTPKFYKLMKTYDTMRALTTKYINQAMKRYENEPSTQKSEDDLCVLEKLLKIDKRVAVVMTMDMMMAGVDTTTSSLVTCLLSLAKNPEKQEKLRQEILKILPNKNSQLTPDNMKNLPYLRACIKESLRVYPVSGGVLRKINDDVVLSGYQVPKGTEVAMMSINLVKDEKHFSRSKEFIPDRWLRNPDPNNSGCPVEATKASNPYIYLPFGFGPRSCIGKRLAEMEIEIALSKIVRNFRVEFDYPTEDIFTYTLIAVPQKELKFKFIDLD